MQTSRLQLYFVQTRCLHHNKVTFCRSILSGCHPRENGDPEGFIRYSHGSNRDRAPFQVFPHPDSLPEGEGIVLVPPRNAYRRGFWPRDFNPGRIQVCYFKAYLGVLPGRLSDHQKNRGVGSPRHTPVTDAGYTINGAISTRCRRFNDSCPEKQARAACVPLRPSHRLGAPARMVCAKPCNSKR